MTFQKPYRYIVLLIIALLGWNHNILSNTSMKHPSFFAYKKVFKYQVFDDTPLNYLAYTHFIGCYIKNIPSNQLFHSSSQNNYFVGSIFETINLSKRNLTKFSFNQTQFINSSLNSLLIQNGTFKLVTFASSKLQAIVFQDSYFKKTSFPNSYLKDLIFINCTFDNETEEALKRHDAIIGFKGLEEKAKNKDILTNHSFFSISFEKLNLNFLTFNASKFDFCIFKNLSLRQISITHSKLYKSSFINIKGFNSVFSNSDLLDTKIKDSNLEKTTFKNVTIVNSEFKNVNFSQSNWKNVTIKNSKFINCQFDDLKTKNVQIINSPTFVIN